MGGFKSRSPMIQIFERVGIKPWQKYIELLFRAKAAGALDLDRFIDAYRDDDSNWKKVNQNKMMTPEKLCQISNTPTGVIMAHIVRQLWDASHPEADMIEAMNLVPIVNTWVKEAKKSGGFRDRELFLKSNGRVPIPSNQTIHLHKHVSVKAIDDTAPGKLPTFEEDMGQDLPLLPSPPEPDTV